MTKTRFKVPLPNPLDEYEERQRRWLWCQLPALTFRAFPSPESPIPVAQRDQIMADALSSQPDLPAIISKILNMEKNGLIPDECFKWIEKNDDRLLIWLFNMIYDFNKNQNPQLIIPLPAITQIPNEERRNVLILAIDNWKTFAQYKQQYLNGLKSTWSQVIAEDKLTKFLRREDEDQLKWALEYLQKSYKALYLNPINTKELYIAALASIDNLSLTMHPAEKKLYIEKMRRTWNQKKYRDSDKAKKVRSFPMSDDVFQMLNECAKRHGKKPFELLEILIRQEHKSNT